MERDEKHNHIIYHYTSPIGLVGIIEKKCMWATDLRYLNDASEFSYTVDLILKVVEKNSIQFDDPIGMKSIP